MCVCVGGVFSGEGEAVHGACYCIAPVKSRPTDGIKVALNFYLISSVLAQVLVAT